MNPSNGVVATPRPSPIAHARAVVRGIGALTQIARAVLVCLLLGVLAPVVVLTVLVPAGVVVLALAAGAWVGTAQ